MLFSKKHIIFYLSLKYNMNGYSNNGYVQSMNGILSLTDGNGTTIENGQIITGDITGEDIVSSSVTTDLLKSINHEISGSLTIDIDLTVDGTIYTNLIDTNATLGNDVYVFPTALGIYVGSTENTITYIRCYLDCLQYAIFRTGMAAYDTSTFQGITNGGLPFTNTLTTDATGLTSAASTTFNGGMIIKKNLYATDVMTNNLATGNITCSTVNSSNQITTAKVMCNTIDCNTITANDIFYKNKICGYINLGVAPYLTIPLTTSILDTTTGITNYNLSTYLTNANSNTLFLLPYYTVVFYNNNIILKISNNSAGTSSFFDNIQFSQVLSCTKILIQYKNLTLL